MDPFEQLPAILNRRSWLILGLLLLVSLLFRDTTLTLGILCGGLVSIGAFLWLRRSLRQLLEEPGSGSKARYQFGYVVRLIALAVVLAVLIAVVKINAVGLIVGLSVVVINLFWAAIQHSLQR
jgi:hypothetical protein